MYILFFPPNNQYFFLFGSDDDTDDEYEGVTVDCPVENHPELLEGVVEPVVELFEPNDGNQLELDVVDVDTFVDGLTDELPKLNEGK